jgi:hypothetical protein
MQHSDSISRTNLSRLPFQFYHRLTTIPCGASRWPHHSKGVAGKSQLVCNVRKIALTTEILSVIVLL